MLVLDFLTPLGLGMIEDRSILTSHKLETLPMGKDEDHFPKKHLRTSFSLLMIILAIVKS